MEASGRAREDEQVLDTLIMKENHFQANRMLPFIRGLSTSSDEISPVQEDSCSSVRLNRFETLNDTAAHPKRVFRKTPPPPRSSFLGDQGDLFARTESCPVTPTETSRRSTRNENGGSSGEFDSSKGSELWPSLPEWPALDPGAFARGNALLGSMEMDPAAFSSDTLCHLALEIFEVPPTPPLPFPSLSISHTHSL